MKHVLSTVIAALALVSAAVAENRPPEPWPGPKGPHFFIEAEAFTELGKGWEVIESTDGFRGNLYGSGEKALSGGPAGGDEARHTIDIPEAGEWTVWVRASQIARAAGRGADKRNEPAPIDLSIRQNNQSAGSVRICDERAEGHGNYVWKSFTARLEAGPATLAALKATPKRVPDHVRRIDCLIVTKDPTYKPDYRDFVPQMYLRLHLLEADQPRARLYQRGSSARVRRGPITDYAYVGQKSPWANITRHYAGDREIIYNWQLDSKVTRCKYAVEFATAPDDNAVVKTITCEGDIGAIQVMAPPNYADGKVPFADYEFAQVRADWVSKFPVIDFGRRPTAFPIIVDTALESGYGSHKANELEWKALEYVGINGHGRLLSPEDLKHGLHHSRLYNSAFYGVDGNGVLVPDLARIRKDMAANAEIVKQHPENHRIVHMKLIDEAQAPDLNRLVANPLAHEKFKQWVKERNHPVFTEQELADFKARGIDPDSQIKLVADRDTPHPGLYYWSQRFRSWTTANYFVQATKIARELYPPHIRTTQNFSDALVNGNLYSQGNDYWTYYRDEKALDVLQTEDWNNGAVTRQLTGWHLAIARSATKYHGQPIHMYVIAASGRRPLEAKLKAYSNIAQGAKFLNLYTYNPKYKSSEVGWAERPDMIVGLAELTREIGAAEHVLLDAYPRKAEAAIIYSVPSDIWNVGYDNAQGSERSFTYLALRHAHVPVDVLCDDDLTAGYLDGYKVAYLFGDQINAQAAAKLAAWVQAGGTLVLSPGAGSCDQYNRAIDILDKALGLPRGELTIKQQVRGGGIGLWKSILKDEEAVKVRLPDGHEVLAYGQVQSLDAREGMAVEATFEDGSPAAVTYAVGNGKVAVRGFLPAISYVTAAYRSRADTGEKLVAPPQRVAQALAVARPDMPKDWRELRLTENANRGALPYAYDLRLSPLLTAPAAGVDRPVQLNTPIVEATLMEGGKGWIVPLANYTGGPVESLTVTVKPSKPFGQVKSARQGDVKSEPQPDGSIKLTIPLETTDFIYAEWAD